MVNNAMAIRHSHRLQRLKEQREKLDARIQATEARIKVSERKKDVRRKILVGAYYLDMAVKESKMDEIKKVMDGYLKRGGDRELFGLNALHNNS
jgi:IS30 family transposase